MTRVAFVTNLATHYRRPLFEELSRRLDVDFYFTSRGRESYWPKEHATDPGSIAVRARGERLALLGVARRPYRCVVASLVGRLSLALTYVCARARRTPFVLWVGIWEHPSTVFHRLSRPIVRRLYRRADAVLVYGTHVADFIARESGRRDGVFVVPQAVDNAAFRRRPRDEDVAAARGVLPTGVLVALYVGRIEREKGLEVLVRALAAAPAWHLSVVGDGGARVEVETLARALGCSDRIRFRGYVEQHCLRSHLYAADVLVVPSVSTATFREPWALVVNEAMNAGLPVIASDAVGAAAGGLVVDGQTGFVVPQRSPDALSGALVRLEDESVRAKFGAAAKKHVADWTFAAAADAIESVIRRVSR